LSIHTQEERKHGCEIFRDFDFWFLTFLQVRFCDFDLLFFFMKFYVRFNKI